MSNENFIVEGIVHWANINEPNQKGRYDVVISIDDKVMLKKLKGLGFTLKEKEGKGYCVTLKTKNKPTIVDAKKNILSGEILLGHGSKIRAIVNHYKVAYEGKYYDCLGLNHLQILELKEYNPGGGLDLFGEEKGYVADTTDSKADSPITFEDIEDTDLFK